MSERTGLNELQIKRRELENELASVSQKEIYLKGDLKKLEADIITHLEEAVKAKKVILSGLESQKCDLERRLRDFQRNSVVSQPSEEQHAKGETGEPQQEATEENEVKLTVVESQPQQIEESGQRTRTEEKHNLLF
jgi:hypothetical protein